MDNKPTKKPKSSDEIVAKLKTLLKIDPDNNTLFRTGNKVNGIWLDDILDGKF